MTIRAPFIFFVVLAFVICTAGLRADLPSGIDAYSDKASGVSQKRFERKSWSKHQQSDLMQKSFAFKEWDLHFSPLGSKKSNISLTESKEKQRFESKTIEFPTKKMDFSEWDGRLAALQSQAQISTDKTAQKIADKRMYESMLKTSKKYADMGETLSLRDINRYQFRQNRSDSAVPVRTAGVGDDS